MSKKIVIVAFVLFCILLFSVVFALINIANTKIIKGIQINGIDVSNLTKDEAITKLNNIVNLKNNNKIIINIDENNKKNIDFDYFEISYNIQESVEIAYNFGRSNNIFKNNFEILDILINKRNIDIRLNLNNDNIMVLLNEINSELPNKFIESNYYIQNKNLVINKGVEGNIVDEDLFKKDLYKVLSDCTIFDNIVQVTEIKKAPNSINIDKIYDEIYKLPKNAYYETNPFKVTPEVIGISFDKNVALNMLEQDLEEYIIPLNYTYPEITINNLGIDIFKNSLAYYSTKYNLLDDKRSNNLELAASKVNGIVLNPGETFSYNTIVGARTINAGYQDAAIYSDGKVVDGIGGGICQISSTIYNAVVLANLEIKERHNHQFLTSYVPAGRDATVVYGSKDLKFVNTRSYPIKLEMKVENGIASCTILGIYEDTEYIIDFDVETVSSTEPPVKYEYDSELPDNTERVKQKGSNAMHVKVYKITKLNGSIKSKELLSEDKYKSLDKIIITKNIKD